MGKCCGMRLNGLKNVLKKFDEHGWKGSFDSGNWTIANGGYDLWFTVYYKGEPVADCIAGKLSSGYDNLDISEKTKLLKKIQSVYEHLKIDFGVQETGTAGLVAGESAAEEPVKDDIAVSENDEVIVTDLRSFVKNNLAKVKNDGLKSFCFTYDDASGNVFEIKGSAADMVSTFTITRTKPDGHRCSSMPVFEMPLTDKCMIQIAEFAVENL